MSVFPEMSDDGPADAPAAFRWRLDGDRPLPLALAHKAGRAARATFMRVANGLGVARLPDAFHHGDARSESAFWLPEDEDGEGVIDHLLCLFEPALPPEMLPAFATGGVLALTGIGAWRLAPVWMGRRGAGGLFGPARRWVSVTPYVTPLDVRRRPGEGARGTRPGRSLADQIVRDLVRHGGAAPDEIRAAPARPLGAGLLAAADFTLDAGGHARPRDPDIAFLDLTFDAPRRGPLALGWGAHFGLGLFAPVGDGD